MKITFDILTGEKGEQEVKIRGDGKEIGQIFAKGSYSGENTIQICGFKMINGPWGCNIYRNTKDCCLVYTEVCEHSWKQIGETVHDNTVMQCSKCQLFRVIE